MRTRWTIEVACGSNNELRERLRRDFGTIVTAYGFIPEMYRKLSNYDLVITKPGSATLMELLELRVPFLLMPGIPGIEDDNADEITKVLGVPLLRSSDLTQYALRSVIREDGSLTAAGYAWITGLETLRASLPSEGISMSDLA